MKYIKYFESNHIKTIEAEVIKRIDDLLKEYEKYVGKYVIIEYKSKNTIFLGKFKAFVLNGYFVGFEFYDWDDFYNGYQTSNETLHLTDFSVLEASDSFPEIKKDYEMFMNANKYNL